MSITALKLRLRFGILKPKFFKTVTFLSKTSIRWNFNEPSPDSDSGRRINGVVFGEHEM